MPLSNTFKALPSALVLLTAVYGSTRLVSAGNQSNPPAEGKTQACPNDESGLTLRAGFCATIFADGITIVHSPATPVLNTKLKQLIFCIDKPLTNPL